MKKLALLLCLLLFSFSVFSQNTIKGQVVNANTGEALAGSSVFISGTSVGTVSDKSGYFELNNVPSGRYDLIISSIGYETNVLHFTSEQLPLKVKVEMTVKIKELDNVTVEPFVEEGWDIWGPTFTVNFIGTTPNAAYCKLKNKESIRFRYYKKSNRLVAFSDEPLIIENRALGYNISYQLEEFEVNFSTHTSEFAGYPFFEDISRGGKTIKNRWDKNRNKAYYGSMLHFMRSLYADSLPENGYEVRRMKRVPNLEKERVKKIYNPRIHSNRSNRIASSGTDHLLDSLKYADSLAYYNRIMRQKDYIEIYGRDLLSADSLFIRTDGEYKEMFFKDFLYITYKGELEEKDYLALNFENRKPTFQRSYIILVNGNPVSLDKNGNYILPQEVFSMAYWSWSEKMSDMLPSEYEPTDNLIR